MIFEELWAERIIKDENLNNITHKHNNLTIIVSPIVHV
jgi:hypothetical protein